MTEDVDAIAGSRGGRNRECGAEANDCGGATRSASPISIAQIWWNRITVGCGVMSCLPNFTMCRAVSVHRSLTTRLRSPVRTGTRSKTFGVCVPWLDRSVERSPMPRPFQWRPSNRTRQQYAMRAGGETFSRRLYDQGFGHGPPLVCESFVPRRSRRERLLRPSGASDDYFNSPDAERRELYSPDAERSRILYCPTRASEILFQA